MFLRDAVIKRIYEYVDDDTSLTDICLRSNLTPSTIFDFVNGKTKYCKLITIKKLCNGLGLKLKEFFDTPYFDEDDNIY